MKQIVSFIVSLSLILGSVALAEVPPESSEVGDVVEGPDTAVPPSTASGGEAETGVPSEEAPEVPSSELSAPSSTLTEGVADAIGATGHAASTGVDELICAEAECRCITGRDGDRCASVVCRCAAPPEEQRQQLEVEPSEPPAAEAPPSLLVPVPTAGFTLNEHRLSLRLDAGFPFLDAELLIRLHDAITLGFGYRTMYSFHHAGFGTIKFRVARNRRLTRSLSLFGTGGYGHSPNREVDEFVGVNGAFGELGLAVSFRWGRNALDILGAVRLGWVSGRTCAETDYYYGSGDDQCWNSWFEDGEPGLSIAVILDIGWSIRISPRVSYFFSPGVQINTNSRGIEAYTRFRNGIFIDF